MNQNKKQVDITYILDLNGNLNNLDCSTSINQVEWKEAIYLINFWRVKTKLPEFRRLWRKFLISILKKAHYCIIEALKCMVSDYHKDTKIYHCKKTLFEIFGEMLFWGKKQTSKIHKKEIAWRYEISFILVKQIWIIEPFYEFWGRRNNDHSINLQIQFIVSNFVFPDELVKPESERKLHWSWWSKSMTNSKY